MTSNETSSSAKPNPLLLLQQACNSIGNDLAPKNSNKRSSPNLNDSNPPTKMHKHSRISTKHDEKSNSKSNFSVHNLTTKKQASTKSSTHIHTPSYQTDSSYFSSMFANPYLTHFPTYKPAQQPQQKSLSIGSDSSSKSLPEVHQCCWLINNTKCGKTFYSLEDLRAHVTAHTLEKDFLMYSSLVQKLRTQQQQQPSQVPLSLLQPPLPLPQTSTSMIPSFNNINHPSFYTNSHKFMPTQYDYYLKAHLDLKAKQNHQQLQLDPKPSTNSELAQTPSTFNFTFPFFPPTSTVPFYDSV